MILKPTILQLPKITDIRGNLSFIESGQHIPFSIKRAYWIYDVPGGETRGGHAFKEQDEFIVALSGSFDVRVNDGESEKIFSLNRSYLGLYIPKGCWRQMENFSTNSLALVLASTLYDKNDYIRNYNDFSSYICRVSRECYPEEVQKDSPILLQTNSKTSTVNDCQIIDLDKNHREKGNITVVENRGIIPFDTERVYYLYDIPGGEERGGHAHKDLYQLIIAASGSFDVVLDDGATKRTVRLDRPYQGLYIKPGIWRELINFSSGSSCLVLASAKYSEEDYIRDYTGFRNYKTT
jgi:WxcM-like, C-terminal.